MQISLRDFFHDFSKRFELNSNANILEIGCGKHSLFSDLESFKVIAIDKSLDNILSAKEYSHIEYQASSIQNFQSNLKFDLICDAHCFHCILDENERKKSYQVINNLLNIDGYFMSEMMIQPNHEKVFFKDRIVKTSLEIENELLENNFKIKYFFIMRDLYFEDDDGYKNKCDVLRIVAQK